jgi:hypothetical protein
MFERLVRRLFQIPAEGVFTTPGVARIFLGCRRCGRVVPQYRSYGNLNEPGIGLCRCGCNEFQPRRISEWRAACWVLYGLVWRKWVLKREMWDPRIAQRVVTTTFDVPKAPPYQDVRA